MIYKLYIKVIIIPVAVLLGWFLYLVFSGQVVLHQELNLGPVVVRYYGLIMMLAVLAGYLLAIKRAEKYGIDAKRVDDIIFWVIIGGFLGARLYHVVSSLGYYSDHPLEIVQVWHGGLSIYGALLGGLVALIIVNKIFNFPARRTNDIQSARQFSIFKLFDWLTPSVIVGQIIGRFGNFFNYELFGYPASVPWKMFVPAEFRPGQYQSADYFHPIFLYESLANLFILWVLTKLVKPARPGVLFFSYLLLYNGVRFFLEFLRIDSVFAGGFRVNAFVSLALVLIGAGFLIVKKSNAQAP